MENQENLEAKLRSGDTSLRVIVNAFESLPIIPYERQALEEITEEFHLESEVSTKLHKYLESIEKQVSNIQKYQSKKYPQHFYQAMRTAIIEIHNATSEIYELIKSSNSSLANTLKNLILGWITPLEKALEKRLEMMPNDKEELELKTKRLYAEQSFMIRQSQIQTTLMEHLVSINQLLKKSEKASPHCYISYAWPSNENKEREYWIQPFLFVLYEHLSASGIRVMMDIRDNEPGNSIYQFMKNFRKGEHVILIGTESLLKKYENSTPHIVQNEINFILNNFKEDNQIRVYPLLISGTLKTAYPEKLLYSIARDAREVGYLGTLKRLIDWLYGSRLSEVKQQYENFWQTLYQNIIRLPKDLPEVEQEIAFGYHQKRFDYLKQDIRYEAVKVQQESIDNRMISVNIVANLMESMGKNSKPFIDEYGQQFQRPAELSDFIKRTIIYDKVKNYFSSINSEQKTLTICGLGGVGKTILAQYCYVQPFRPYALRAWFHAESREMLCSQYIKFAEVNRVKISENSTIEEKAMQIKQWLDKKNDCLLIYDNVPEVKVIEGLLPEQNTCDILITSRNEIDWSIQKKLVMDVMTEEEAIDLIIKITGVEENKENLKKLVNILGRLPLALAQAGAYIVVKALSIENYLKIYQLYKAKLLSEKTSQSPKHESVWNTFEMNFNALKAECPKALCTLKQAAWLSHASIPENLLYMLVDCEMQEKDLTWNNIKEFIKRYSLMQINVNQACLGIHPLVQEILRSKQETVEQVQIFKKICDCVNELTSNYLRIGSLEYKTLLSHAEQLFQHGQSLIRLLESKDTVDESHLLKGEPNQLGTIYQAMGLPDKALKFYEAVVKEYELQYGKNHFKTSIILMNIGKAFGDLGDYKKQKDYLTRALDIQQEHYGKDHLVTCTTLINLSKAISDLGDYEKQKDYLIRALDIQQKQHADDHIEISIILTNLGIACGYLGEYEQQKNYLTRALTIQEKFYGNEHPEIGNTLANLGTAWGNLGDYKRQKEFLTRSLAIQENHYGIDHFETRIPLTILGNAHGNLNDYEKQKYFLERALMINKKHFGDNHPQVAIALYNLANANLKIGNIEKNESLIIRSCEQLKYAQKIYHEYFREGHPNLTEIEKLLTNVESLIDKKHNLIQPLVLSTQKMEINEVQQNPNITLLKEESDNIAIQKFIGNSLGQQDLRKLNSWYNTNILTYLTHLLPAHPDVFRYVFVRDNANEEQSYYKQFVALCHLSRELETAIYFIAAESPISQNHFIFGVIVGEEMLIVNPVGITQHKDFFDCIVKIKQHGKLRQIYESNVVLQKDAEGLTSCGPLCSELMQHISLLPLKTILQSFDTWRSTLNDKVDITSLLSDPLQQLSRLEGVAYQEAILRIRAKHLNLLEQCTSEPSIEAQNEKLQACVSCSEQSLMFEMPNVELSRDDNFYRIPSELKLNRKYETLWCKQQYLEAIQAGNLAEVRVLLQTNALLLNVLNLRGFTPLMIAIQANQEQILKCLLDRGASLDAGNTVHRDVEGFASFSDKQVLVRLISEEKVHRSHASKAFVEKAPLYFPDFSMPGLSDSIPKIYSPVLKENSWEIDVPHDNSCLFWAAALSYLIPVVQNNDSFQQKFEKLFGIKESGLLKHVQNLMSQYNPFMALKLFDDSIFGRLVREEFRRRVIEYIAERKEAFKEYWASEGNPNETRFEDYLSRMQDPNSWGGDLEIQAISELLGCSIEVMAAGNRQSFLNKCIDKIELVHVNANNDETGGRNHYHFILNNKIAEYYRRAWLSYKDNPMLSQEVLQPRFGLVEKSSSGFPGNISYPPENLGVNEDASMLNESDLKNKKIDSKMTMLSDNMASTVIKGSIKSLPDISFDRAELDEVIEELPLAPDLNKEVLGFIDNIEKHVVAVKRYQSKQHPENFYHEMREALREIRKLGNDIYDKTKYLHNTLPNTLKQLLLKWIAPLEKELEYRLEMPATERDEVELKTKRLYAEQSWIARDATRQKELMFHLEKLKSLLIKSGKPAPRCYISYAWPSKEKKEQEYWVQPFLYVLYDHLTAAGIRVVMDICDSKPGDSIYRFMEQYHEGNYVILVGTESLLQKHKSITTHAVQTELSIILDRFEKDQKQFGQSRIYPMLVSGTIKTAYPEIYDKYRTVRDAREQGYIGILKKLMDWIYDTRVNQKSLEHVRLWQSFYQQHVELGIEVFVVEQEISFGYHYQRLDVLRQDLQYQSVQAQEKTKHSPAVTTEMIGILMKSQGNNPRSLYDENGQQFQRPYSNPDFIERPTLWEKMTQHFANSEQQILTLTAHGLGGMGKTELAGYYYLHPPQPYSLRAWFHAEKREQLCYEYIALAVSHPKGIKFPKEMAIDEQAMHMKEWLESQKDCLLVYDNIPNAKEIEGLLPEKGKHHILMTSRNEVDWPVHQKLDVDVMEEEEAIALIVKMTGLKNTEALKRLVDKLGRLPLALAQAGAYIAIKKMDIEEYLELYLKRQPEVLNEITRRHPKHEPVWVTFNINFKALEIDCPAALMTLKQASWLNHNAIPGILLCLMINDAFPDKEGIWLNIKEQVSLYSLMKVDVTWHQLSMHPLLQDIIRSQQKEIEQVSLFKQVCGVLDRLSVSYDQLGIEPKALIFHAERLHQHGQKIARISDAIGVVEGPELLLTVMPVESGRIYQEIGLINESLLFFKQQLHVYKKVYGKEDLRTIKVQGNLAGSYYAKGDLEKSERLLNYVLEILKSHYDKTNDPDVANTLMNLGNVYCALGNTIEAKEILQRALRIQEEHYGREHPETARYLLNLGQAFLMLGKASESRELLESALIIFQSHSILTHPNVISALANLGRVYCILGDTNKGREMLEQALLLGEKYFGNDHIQVAKILAHLVIPYTNLMNFHKCKELLKQALPIFETHYGSSHAQTAQLMMNLGTAHLELKEIPEARELLERALVLKESTYPVNHPEIASALMNLGNFHRVCGNLEESKRLIEKTLAITESYYGNTHPQMALTLMNLGVTNDALGENFKSITLYEQALAIQEAYYSKDHPNIVQTLLNLGGAYLKLDYGSKAKKILEQALPILETHLYQTNPLLIGVTLNNLSIIYIQLDLLPAAEVHLKRAESIFNQHCLKEDLRLSNIQRMIKEFPARRKMLAKIQGLNQEGKKFYQAKKYEEALISFEKAIQILAVGNVTISQANAILHFNVGSTCMLQQNYQLAHTSLHMAYEMRLKLLGPKHADTVKALNRLQEVKQQLSIENASSPPLLFSAESASNKESSKFSYDISETSTDKFKPNQYGGKGL